MKLPRTWSLALLLVAGTCLPLQAQRKIIETVPGSGVVGSTNAIAPDPASEVRRGGFLDRIYRPNSIQLAPIETGPMPGSSTGAKVDPAIRKRLLEEQARRKNWAVENAARINRGESAGERRRSDSETRRSAGAGRPPTPAELNLQAVDPAFAKEFKEKDAAGNATETSLERAQLRAERQRRQRDAKNSGNPRDPDAPRSSQDGGDDAQDEVDDDLESPSDRDKSKRELSAWDKAAAVSADPFKAESSLDRAAARQAAADLLGSGGNAGGGEIDLLNNPQHQERLAELSTLLGEPAATGGGANRQDSYLAPTRSDRSTEFQRLLAPDATPAPASRLGGELAGGNSGAGLAGAAGAAAIRRDLPGLSAPGAGYNFSPAAPSATFTAPAPRMTPRPIQLPVPVRGKGGF